MRVTYARLLPILLAGLLWPVGAAHAQASDTEAADAHAIILRFASIVQTQELDFGDIVRSRTLAGTVTISPTGTRTSTGGVTPILNTFSAARFIGLGTRNRNVLLNVVPNQVNITNGTGATMRVDNFTIGNLSGLTRQGNSNNYRINAANGQIAFSVGARISVAANQAAGQYSGTYQIVFNYQ
ncbi:MAG: hypothetical protein RLZZ58_437 [Pseudomonadota bacterium]|jgi:hypothetical protein